MLRIIFLIPEKSKFRVEMRSMVLGMWWSIVIVVIIRHEMGNEYSKYIRY